MRNVVYLMRMCVEQDRTAIYSSS